LKAKKRRRWGSTKREETERQIKGDRSERHFTYGREKALFGCKVPARLNNI
jgi:hypothetical protein